MDIEEVCELNDIEQQEVNISEFLEFLGEEPMREGLKDTPVRYVKFMREFTEHHEFKFTTFSSEGSDELILESEIPFYSLCEHHLIPFFGTAAVAYIPDGRIAGLSKLARTIEAHARGLQNQERITFQSARYISNVLKPRGVAVIIKARHLCMEMRGVKKPGTITTTSAMLGVFREDSRARSEILNLLK